MMLIIGRFICYLQINYLSAEMQIWGNLADIISADILACLSADKNGRYQYRSYSRWLISWAGRVLSHWIRVSSRAEPARMSWAELWLEPGFSGSSQLKLNMLDIFATFATFMMNSKTCTLDTIIFDQLSKINAWMKLENDIFVNLTLKDWGKNWASLSWAEPA